MRKSGKRKYMSINGKDCTDKCGGNMVIANNKWMKCVCATGSHHVEENGKHYCRCNGEDKDVEMRSGKCACKDNNL